MTPTFRLDGSRALVTGGSRGMGFAIARAYAEAGADVILAARSEADLHAAAERLAPTGRRIGVEVIDLARVDAVAPRFEDMLERHGPIDILVNCAAVASRGRAIDMPVQEFEATLRLDLSSPFALSQAFAKARVERGEGGRIVNVASVASLLAVRTPSTAYASAKAGMLLMTKQMAYEFARHGILVNAIAPGYVATDMSKAFRANAQGEAWRQARVPLERWGEPEDVAGAALLFASPAGSFITGSVLTVDGGLTCVV